MDASHTGAGLELGTAITPAVEEAFNEAAGMASGGIERLYVRGLIDRVRGGELGLLALRCGGEMAGAMCYRSVDGEAELVYGFLRPPYAGGERAFLDLAIGALARSGARVVRTGFTWPGGNLFIAAAAQLGFSSVHRVSMAKDVGEHHLFSYVPRPGIAVLPWSPAYFDEACRVMYEESEPEDRRLYPLFGTPEGTRALLLSIVQGRHGTFLPGLSAVCEIDGALAGCVFASQLVDGSVLVLDIAVRRACRRRGAGTKMLEHLIGKCAGLGRRQVVLAVTADNAPAIGLYRKVGFRETATFDQYVLNIQPSGNQEH